MTEDAHTGHARFQRRVGVEIILAGLCGTASAGDRRPFR